MIIESKIQASYPSSRTSVTLRTQLINMNQHIFNYVI